MKTRFGKWFLFRIRHRNAEISEIIVVETMKDSSSLPSSIFIDL